MNKKYEYNGNIYCEDDLSEEIDNYGGDLYDLYWSLKESRLVGGNNVLLRKKRWRL